MDPITLAIDGKRYRLVAEIVPLGQKAEFTLRAIHKQTGRTSVVNQLNAILCTFFAGNFPEEWPWTVSWDKALSWAQTFVSIARTSATATWNQLAYLEDRLDEDRAEGEWANVVVVASSDDALTHIGKDFIDDEDDAEMRAVLAHPAKFKDASRGEPEPPEPDFPFCGDCAKPRDGQPCDGCGAWVCPACEHPVTSRVPPNRVLCGACYRQWCDDEKERHARALDYRDTPLAEQLDDNPVPGIDY
jgi:hypothetical protein